MAKNKKSKKEKETELKPFEILKAAIKDDFCNYTYRINTGVGAGDTHSVKGTGVVMEDMKVAFSMFNAHLAAADCAFLYSNTEVNNIDNFHDHELTGRYDVTEFEMGGTVDSPSIILKGTKHSPVTGGRMDCKSNKIALDRNAFYQWYNELKQAAEDAIIEVERYKDGHCTAPTMELDTKQMAITDVEFESGKVE